VWQLLQELYQQELYQQELYQQELYQQVVVSAGLYSFSAGVDPAGFISFVFSRCFSFCP
jgi:hypothetical protein